MGQLVLFPGAAPPKARKLEVHEHSFIRGPRSRWAGTDAGRLIHSHEGGDQPHSHPDTGPASYTIDKDEWFQATGLRGGGRKKFTATPNGEQFEVIPRAPEEDAFEIVFCDPPAPAGFTGEGGGHYTAARMVLAFDLRPIGRRAKATSTPA